MNAIIVNVRDILNVIVKERKQKEINNNWHDNRSTYYINGVDK